MNISFTGLPALVLQVGFIVVFSAPVWLAARVVGANNPTIWRSILSVLVGTLGALGSAAIAGPAALLLAPLAYLLSFKYVLGTSFIGALVLAIVAAAGYAAMVHFIGAGMHVTGDQVSV